MTTLPTLDLAPYTIDTEAPETTANSEVLVVAGPSDPTAEQITRAVEVSGTLTFWDRPEEDIYTLEDGDPV